MMKGYLLTKIVTTIFVNLLPVSGQLYGNEIGPLIASPPTTQRATGTVFSVDTRTIFIRDFTFDGSSVGTDAGFFAGSSESPNGTGVIIPDEQGTTSSLGDYNGEDLVLTLPDNNEVTNFSWIAVWDVQLQVAYGFVLVPEGFLPPTPFNLGALGYSPPVHNVQADYVVIENTRQITFEGFNYDGQAPDVYFWTGEGIPDSSDIRVADPNGNIERELSAYNRGTFTLTLPENYTVFDTDFIGVWCETLSQDFGHLAITDEDRANVPPFIEESPQNCVELIENMFQVAWQLDERRNTIYLEMRGRIAPNEYMSFGISGSDTGTQVVDSGVTLVWINQDTREPQAEDFSPNVDFLCISGGAFTFGICPDTLLPGGTNDVVLLGTTFRDGVFTISFERYLSTDDPLDRPIPTDQPVFISWGLGVINENGLASLYETRPEGDVQINFGATGLTCPDFTPLVNEEDLEPWTIEPLITEGADTFTALIGPAGGARGYEGITDTVGCGSAWYINGSLIPNITVQRGSTYRFEVFGGADSNISASYNPFYITNCNRGGFAQKSAEEMMMETIYAGPVEGALCEYQSTYGVDPNSLASFEEFFKTLTLNCTDGEPGILMWTVAADTPDTVHYQSYMHPYLGWRINVVGDGPPDPCTPSPCLNEGSCFSLGDEIFFCFCPGGFSGVTCEIDSTQDPCDPSPCFSGGTCIPLGGTNFVCSCFDGYSGNFCQVVDTPDLCDPSPCFNGGTCIPLGGMNFFCSCPGGFSGNICQVVNTPDPCDRFPCFNDGTCIPLGGMNFFCSCPGGFSGNTCEIERDPCVSSPCINGGTCTTIDSQNFQCECVDGFAGVSCETVVCPVNYCQNNGFCQVNGIEFVCFCQDSYTGQFCEEEKDPCDESRCLNNATCVVNEDSSISCDCVTGFAGPFCETDDTPALCDPSPCINGGTCTPFGNTAFFCSCPEEFSGITCEVDDTPDPCNPPPCLNGGTCIPLGGTNFICACSFGFSGNTCQVGDTVPPTCDNLPADVFEVIELGEPGLTVTWIEPTCQDLDTASVTQRSATSPMFFEAETVTDITFTCTDRTGNTAMCGFKVTVTTLQNACTSNPCQNGGSCTLSGTSGFTCSCLTGFTGTTCTQIQNACTPNPCQNGGSCTLSGISGFICRCVTGFTGTTCTQIQNACTPNPCQNGGSCNLSGTSGFTCRCVTGFTGTTCTQIQNACTPNPCQNGGSCTLSGTSGFTCRCVAGFTGITCTQIQNACTPNPCQNGGSCTLSGTSGFTCRCLTGFTGTTCTQTESQLENCPEDDLMFDNFDIITWTEPTHSGGTLIFQSHTSGGEFPVGRSTVVYTFDVNGQNETCEFDVVVGEISNPGGQLPVLEFSEREDEEQQSFSLSQTTPALISCTVKATDGFAPDITWYKDDRQLQSGDGGGRIFYGAGGQFLVLFPPLNSEDGGQYRCEASIPSQPVSGIMEITVTLTE